MSKGTALTRTQAVTLGGCLVNRFGGSIADMEICGSYRRCAESMNDVDIVILPKKGMVMDVVEGLKSQGYTGGEKRLVNLRKNGIQVDVYICPDVASWGAMLLFATGSGGFNQYLRVLAKGKGMLLNQYGLYVRATAARVPGTLTEKSIIRALRPHGRTSIPPEERGRTWLPREEQQVSVASFSMPDVVYKVKLVDNRAEACTCPHFVYRHVYCKHMAQAENKVRGLRK